MQIKTTTMQMYVNENNYLALLFCFLKYDKVKGFVWKVKPTFINRNIKLTLF